VNEDQIAAPGTEDLLDLYTSAPQTGFVFSGNFPGYSQLYMELHAVAGCAAGTVGACCFDAINCTVTTEQACTDGGGVFTNIGVSCTGNPCIPPPANNDCLNAITLASAFGTYTYDNAGATEDGPQDCDTPFGHNGVDNDVWFFWEAPCNGTARLETCGLTGTDDKFVVYQSSSCGDLNTVVACDDDGCTNAPPFESAANFAITDGTTYLIRIGNFLGETGQDGSQFMISAVGVCTPGNAFCDADWCQDGTVGVPDIFCFLSDWFANDPIARNYGGTPGVPAIFAFLSIWFATGIGPCTP